MNTPLPHFLMPFEIVENNLMIEQFRFPRTGKKRIRDKWARKRSNSRPMRKAIQFGRKLICHPQFARELRKLMQEGQ